ncbi:MAG: methyltransferase domain-containing protein [Pseudomonadota bacterium]
MPLSDTPSVPNATIPIFQQSLGSWRLRLERTPFDRPSLAQHYDRAAQSWQRRIERLGMGRAYARLVRQMLRHAPNLNAGPNVHALDCGIGTGALSVALARALPGRAQIEGVDVSPAMLAAARARLAPSHALQGTSLADIRALPHAAGQFDLTMAAHVVEHVACPQDALAEMVRVTRPGGRIMLCLTRRSILGLFVQARWRTHGFRPAEVAPLLRSVGLLEVQRLSSGSRLFDAFSTAWVATKPDDRKAEHQPARWPIG